MQSSIAFFSKSLLLLFGCCPWGCFVESIALPKLASEYASLTIANYFRRIPHNIEGIGHGDQKRPLRGLYLVICLSLA